MPMPTTATCSCPSDSPAEVSDPATVVRHVQLTDMRNYESQAVSFTPGVNVLVGSNGQGKTNLVEAIIYLSTLSSHRVATDAPLIRHGADRAVIQAEAVREDRSLILEIDIMAGSANKARLNRNPVPRTRDILGILRTVVFAPEDLTLVTGDPGDRRRFLDELLIQRQPRLQGVRADFDRVLKQRNTLLKSAGAARRGNTADVEATLVAWDDQLARLGAQITIARRDLVAAIAPLTAAAYAELIPHGDTVGLEYRGSVEEAMDGNEDEVAAELLTLLASKRREELDRGITLVGPHRDEMHISLGPAPLKGYASHGESWSAALALRLASFDLLTAEGAAPILVLDDVFAELDSSRREHVAERVLSAPQVLVTAAVEGDVPGQLDGRWFTVASGTVTPHD